MFSDGVDYLLAFLSFAGVLCYIVCFAWISIYRIKESRFLQKLSLFLIFCFVSGVIGLVAIPQTSGSPFFANSRIICLLGIVFSFMFFLVLLPCDVVKSKRDKKAIKPFVIGMCSLWASIGIAVFLHKAHFLSF